MSLEDADYFADEAAPPATGNDRRWLPLMVVCLGALMIAINVTIVAVALPSIKVDLRFSDASLVWVVNAYLITFGSFLLLGGRLGDVFGQRRLFLLGITFFTLASLGCGLASSPALLVSARLAQGLGGAIVSAVTLSQVMKLFPEPAKRAKALGIYVFVTGGGGSIGLLLGGVLTSALSWHSVFLVNVPIGAAVYILCLAMLPPDGKMPARGPLDIAGAVTVTTSLMLAVYAITEASQAGWSSLRTLALLATAGALMATFIGIETRAQTPLMPLELLRIHNLPLMSIVGTLLTIAVLVWRFVSALHLQLVLHFSPLQVGLAFLPANLIIAGMSLVVAPMVVIRFGIRRPLVMGMLMVAGGLALLARASLSGNLVFDVLPGMLLLGLGTGLACNPMLLGALEGVAPSDSGAASGMVNTAFTMGGAVGLAVVASTATMRTDALVMAGASLPLALSSSYRGAFYVGAILAALAALIAGLFLGDEQQRHSDRERS